MQLELYLRTFSQEQVLVIDQAELLSDRNVTLGKIFAFLEVDDAFYSPHFDSELLKSEGRKTYPPGFARFIGHRVRPHSSWLSPRIRTSLRRIVETLFLSPLEVSPLDDDSRSRLEQLYASDVARLRELTGKTFPAWSI
jgi:hypothetical protein